MADDKSCVLGLLQTWFGLPVLSCSHAVFEGGGGVSVDHVSQHPACASRPDSGRKKDGDGTTQFPMGLALVVSKY